MKPAYIPIILFLATLALIPGCDQPAELGRETDERAFRRGQRLLREGLPEEALTAFLSVISARPDAAESHLEAGLIYLNQMNDPLASIYHFRYYLLLKPDSGQAEQVRQLVQQAKKEYLRDLPGNPFGNSVEKQELLDRIELYQTENENLKRTLIEREKQIEAARQQIQSMENRLAEWENRPAQETGSAEVAPIVIENREPSEPETPDQYTVQSGDTLSRISQKVYGTSGRWMDIFQANRDQLPSPNALKPGQELVIP